MQAWNEVATLSKVKNTQGGFVAYDATGLSRFIELGTELFFVPPLLDVPRSGVVDELKAVSNGYFEIHFDNINDRDTAEVLVGSHCLMRDKRITQELAREDLLGWSLYDEDKFVGTIMTVAENPAQPLLVLDVKGRSEEALVPLAEELVLERDEEHRRLVMDLPAGLLDI